jgi:hypothetical protein
MGLGSWINRKRHNRGFGIQSPSAFFFITQVLKERRAYYAYTQLDKATTGSRRHAREMFRIANYLKPVNCISVGATDAACAMLLAKPSVQHHAFMAEPDAEAKTLLSSSNCNVINSLELFNTVIKELGVIGMLYIDATENTMPLVQAALPYTDAQSVIVVAGIHRNKKIREWWQLIVSDTATVITYDMYSYGLLFFDKEKRKQHYTLKR